MYRIHPSLRFRDDRSFFEACFKLVEDDWGGGYEKEGVAVGVHLSLGWGWYRSGIVVREGVPDGGLQSGELVARSYGVYPKHSVGGQNRWTVASAQPRSGARVVRELVRCIGCCVGGCGGGDCPICRSARVLRWWSSRMWTRRPAASPTSASTSARSSGPENG